MKQLKSINESKVEHYEFPGLASFSCRQDLEFGQIKTEFRKKAFLLVRSNGSRHLILFQGQQLPEDHVRRSSKLKMQLWNTWWTLDLNLNYIFSIWFNFQVHWKPRKNVSEVWWNIEEKLGFHFSFFSKKKNRYICAIHDYFPIPIFSSYFRKVTIWKVYKKSGKLGKPYSILQYQNVPIISDTERPNHDISLIDSS